MLRNFQLATSSWLLAVDLLVISLMVELMGIAPMSSDVCQKHSTSVVCFLFVSGESRRKPKRVRAYGESDSSKRAKDEALPEI